MPYDLMGNLKGAGIVAGMAGAAVVASTSFPREVHVAKDLGIPEREQREINLSRNIALGAGVASLFLAPKIGVHRAHLRLGLFLGGSFAANTYIDVSKKRGLHRSVTANAVAGGAGLLAYIFTKRLQTNFVSLLLNGRTTKNFATTVERTYANILAKQPKLKYLMAGEALPILTAAGAIPLAHTQILRATVKQREVMKKYSTALNSSVDNQAGENTQRTPIAGQHYEVDENVIHTGVHVSSHIIERAF